MLKNVANTDKHLCCSCGICEGLCNQGAITMKENVEGFYVPEIDMNKCNNCGLCYAVCPGDKINDKQIYSSMNQAVPKDYLIGNVKECFNGKIKDKELRDKCTSGGMVTGIIKYLLEAEQYDVAFCVDTYNYSNQVRTVLIKKGDDLNKTLQSRYVTVSHSNLVKYMLANRDKKIIIVAVGCVMAGIRYLIEKFKLNPRNYLCLGLFCACQYSYRTWDYFQLYNRKDNLTALEFRNKNGKRYAYGMIKATYGFKEKIMHTIHRAYIKSDFSMERCLYCTDLLNVYADISFGDNNTKTKDGESCTVIVRSELGEKVIELYEKQKMFYKEVISVDVIKDVKDRRKREYFQAVFANEHNRDSIYADRTDVEENVWRQYEDAYHKKIKKHFEALDKSKLKSLWFTNQLRYYKLKIFNKSYLSELPQKQMKVGKTNDKDR